MEAVQAMQIKVSSQLSVVVSRMVLPQRQRGRISAPLLLAGIVIALLVLVGMVFVTARDSTPAVEAPVAGTIERSEPAPAQTVAPVQTTEAATVTAPAGDFGARQLPPPVPTVSAQDSPVLNLSDEQRADGVVIAGQLLEAIEEEAEKEKAETGAVPLSSPQ
jgi:hypothetical protein